MKCVQMEREEIRERLQRYEEIHDKVQEIMDETARASRQAFIDWIEDFSKRASKDARNMLVRCILKTAGY